MYSYLVVMALRREETALFSARGSPFKSAVWMQILCVAMTVLMLFERGETSQDFIQEICDFQTYQASCSEGRVILIDSAQYGRFETSSCGQLESNERPCFTDVQKFIDKLCGGRKSCNITLPNQELHKISTTCSKERTRRLKISYHCQEVYTASNYSCITNQSIPLPTPGGHGYLANIVTDETNKGVSACPWKIQLQPGQTVHLTLLDFGFLSNASASDINPVCNIYATVKDSFSSFEGQGTLICAGNKRERQLLSSTAKEVQIAVTKSRAPIQDRVYFLIKYEVTGCQDYVGPEDTTVEKISNGYRVTCKSAESVSWEVQCTDGRWIPTKDYNCAATASDASPDTTSAFGLNQGVLIVIVIGVALVISTLIIVIGIFLLCRRKTFSPSEGLLDSPVFDKHGNMLYSTPMLGKRNVIPNGVDQSTIASTRDYATTLQMRQMVLPSAVMQHECIPFTGGDIWMCPVHGVRTGAIVTGNGSLARRSSSCRQRMEHIYELPTFEIEEEIQTPPTEVLHLTPESPFYHELDPNLPEEARIAMLSGNMESSVSPTVPEASCSR